MGPFFAKLLTMWKDPKGRWALAIGGFGIAIIDGALLLTELKAPEWTFLVGIVSIIIAMPLYVIVGYDTAHDLEENLCSGEQFLLKHADELWQNNHLPPKNRREALLELVSALAKPLPEGDYLTIVMTEIEVNSVWAACGRKSDQIAPQFWDAAVASRGDGNYIERVFFPPQNRAEVKAVKKAITPHLEKKMLVRVFNAETTTPGLQNKFDLPGGFGMTLIGTAGSPNANLECDPTTKQLVLIHWGGLDERHAHFGVILKHDAWKNHFFELFGHFRSLTSIANGSRLAGTCDPMAWKKFLANNKHYKKARRMR